MKFEVNTIQNAPEEAAEVLDKVKQSYGFVPNLMGVLANSPETAEAYLTVSSLFEATSLTATERQIVLLSASVANACSYCVAAHTVIAEMQNVPKEVVEAIRAGNQIADPKLEALRAYAAEATSSRGNVSPDTASRFFAAGYDGKNAIEVILGITQKTLSNYVNHIAETPLDKAFASAEWGAEDNEAAAAG